VKRALACACGDRRFAVRLHREVEVGLVTCSGGGHPSLLLDSRDYWQDVLQTARPREARCRCGGRAFEVELTYCFREDGKSIRSIDVGLRCVACGHERIAATFGIDYEPTETLLGKPLDPCPEPWLKAKWTEVSALWLSSDVHEVVTYLGNHERADVYFAGWRERPRRMGARDVTLALADAASFDVFFAVRDVDFPSELRDCWKRLPVIHLPSPIHMSYRTGNGELYFLRWAEEFLIDGQVSRQEAQLIDLGNRLRSWLATRFVSERGKGTFDNRAEYERLMGGW
jgi:hypothetical protein